MVLEGSELSSFRVPFDCRNLGHICSFRVLFSLEEEEYKSTKTEMKGTKDNEDI